MDGVALTAADAAAATESSPVVLPLRGAAYAGALPSAGVARGTAIEVTTGAMLPPGTDCVIPHERLGAPLPPQGEPVAVIVQPPQRGEFVAPADDLVRKGAPLAQPGTVVTPALVGVLASCGWPALHVVRRPQVALMPTGDELVALGSTLGPGQVFGSNVYALDALVTSLGGGESQVHPPIPDELPAVEAALLDVAARADLVVTIGGSGRSRRDHVGTAVGALGSSLAHGLAVRPGASTLLGTLRAGGGTSVPLVGLPGHPAAASLIACVLVVPAVRALGGMPPWQPQSLLAPLAAPLRAEPGVHQLILARRTQEGSLQPLERSVGDYWGFLQSEGIIQMPPGTPSLARGQMVSLELWPQLWRNEAR